jgi:hypothetical protein
VRVGVRVGPVSVSARSSNRRMRGRPSASALILIPLIAVADMLASGGMWVYLGWTIVGITVLIGLAVMCNRASSRSGKSG